jgi:hypothetical protein
MTEKYYCITKKDEIDVESSGLIIKVTGNEIEFIAGQKENIKKYGCEINEENNRLIVSDKYSYIVINENTAKKMKERINLLNKLKPKE